MAFAFNCTAQAKDAFQCVDGNQTFTVIRRVDGTYFARHRNIYGVSTFGNCQRSGRGADFRCYSSDAIAKVSRSGVEISLDGEFGPYNSDTVTELRCR